METYKIYRLRIINYHSTKLEGYFGSCGIYTATTHIMNDFLEKLEKTYPQENFLKAYISNSYTSEYILFSTVNIDINILNNIYTYGEFSTRPRLYLVSLDWVDNITEPYTKAENLKSKYFDDYYKIPLYGIGKNYKKLFSNKTRTWEILSIYYAKRIETEKNKKYWSEKFPRNCLIIDEK